MSARYVAAFYPVWGYRRQLRVTGSCLTDHRRRSSFFTNGTTDLHGLFFAAPPVVTSGEAVLNVQLHASASNLKRVFYHFERSFPTATKPAARQMVVNDRRLCEMLRFVGVLATGWRSAGGFCDH